MAWLCPASIIVTVSSVLLLCRLKLEVIILPIPTREFASGLASRCSRPRIALSWQTAESVRDH